MVLRSSTARPSKRRPSSAETIFTGDVLHGIQVISHLSLSSVPPNGVTRYYLRTPAVNGGLDIHLPIWVARGPPDTLQTGKTLSLSSGVHGDEHNSIRVVQRILKELEASDCSQLNGTVIGVPAVNPPGLYLRQREYFTTSQLDGGNNLNLVFPGKDPESKPSGPNGLAYRLWNGVWGGGSNVDVHVDLHTTMGGMAGVVFAYANYRVPSCRRVAELAEPDAIVVDQGLEDDPEGDSTIQGAFTKCGIPSITLELGSGNEWHKPTIQRGIEYIHRLMVDMGIQQGSENPYEPDLSNTVVAGTEHSVPARYSGWVDMLVAPGEFVTVGQKLATILNSWGDLLEEIIAPVEGMVLYMARHPGMEAGGTVAVLVCNNEKLRDKSKARALSSNWPDDLQPLKACI